MFYLRSATGHSNKEFGVLRPVARHTFILVSDYIIHLPVLIDHVTH